MDKSVQSSEPTVYALKPEFYTVKNVVIAPKMAFAHWDAKGQDGHGRVYKVTHVILAVFEMIPGVGQVVSLFEMVIVRGTRYFFPLDLPKLAGKQEPQTPSSDLPSYDQVMEHHTPTDTGSPDPETELPSSPPVAPLYMGETPKNVTVIVLPVVQAEETCPDQELPSSCLSSSSYDYIPELEPEPVLEDAAPVLTPARPTLPPKIKIVLLIQRLQRKAIARKARSSAMEQSSAVIPAQQKREYTTFQQGVLSAISWYNYFANGLSFAANIGNSQTFQVVNNRLTVLSPSLAQLFPETFVGINKALLLAANPLYLPFLGSAQSKAEEIVDRMVQESARIAPRGEQIAQQDGALYASVAAANQLLNRADAMYNAQYCASAGFVNYSSKLKNSIARGIAQKLSRQALSDQEAGVIAKELTTALQKTMQETLQSMQQAQGPASDAAKLMNRPFMRMLGYLGDKFLSDMITTGLLNINDKVNQAFTRKTVVNEVGNIVISFVVDQVVTEVIVPPEVLEAANFLTNFVSPALEAGQLALLNMHMLQYMKHLFVLHNALTRTGDINFKLILASKEQRGDPNVAEAVTALCSILGRGNATRTAAIENGLRNALAMWELFQHVTDKEQRSFSDALLAAMEADQYISRATAHTVNSSLAGMMQTAVDCWNAPPSAQVEKLKQVLAAATAEAAAVRVEASGNHVELAATYAIQQSLSVSVENRAMAAGVKAGRIALNIAAGNILGALFNTGAAIATQVVVTVGKDKAVELAVNAMAPSDIVATLTAQFCIVTGRVQEHLNGQSN